MTGERYETSHEREGREGRENRREREEKRESVEYGTRETIESFNRKVDEYAEDQFKDTATDIITAGVGPILEMSNPCAALATVCMETAKLEPDVTPTAELRELREKAARLSVESAARQDEE